MRGAHEGLKDGPVSVGAGSVWTGTEVTAIWASRTGGEGVVSLYEYAGGDDALHKLEELFYSRVLADPSCRRCLRSGARNMWIT